MPLIDEATRERLRERLAGPAAPVELRPYRSGRLVLSRARGADRQGVGSTRNVDLVRSIGADHVIRLHP
jgi:hypothetical protein